MRCSLETSDISQKKSENHNIGMVWSENWKKEHSHVVVVAVCNCEDDCDELLTP